MQNSTKPVKAVKQKKTSGIILQKMIEFYYIVRQWAAYYFQDDITYLLIVPENLCQVCRTELTLCIETLHQKGYNWSIGMVQYGSHKQIHSALANQRRYILQLEPRQWLKYASLKQREKLAEPV